MPFRQGLMLSWDYPDAEEQVMSHKVFIPITDEILYDYPELITAPLRPYQIDNPCFHWMATIEAPEQTEKPAVPIKKFDHRMALNRNSFQIGSRLA